MSNLAEIKINIAKVLDSLRPKIIKAVAIEAEKTVRKNFTTGGRPKWQALAKSTIRTKRKAGKGNILRWSGALMNVRSVADIPNNRIQLITDPRTNAYAKIQNEGGVINMPARTMKLRKNKSGRSVFASSQHKKFRTVQAKPYQIKIPARPFMMIPKEDIVNFERVIKLAISSN